MKRVLIVHPLIRAVGGAHYVAAWTLQALRPIAELTLLSWRPPDLDEVNDFCDTSLQAGDFRFESIGETPRRLIEALPMSSYLLRMSLLLRRCRELDLRHRYDVLLSTFNEVDFGRRGIQYIHVPGALQAPDDGRPAYHPVRIGLAAYERVCARIAGASQLGLRVNLTLVNSKFIGERVREVYGIPSRVLHPPISKGFAEIPWSERLNAIICVGRFHPSKRLAEAIEIVEDLRRIGHQLRLTIVATPNKPSYERHIRRLAAERSEWVTILSSIPRSALVEQIARHRYAIHPMIDEHFGMAVAECQRAGCIPFVHASGGPLEIIGNDHRLSFRDTDSAVEKIDRVLRDDELARDLLAGLRPRRDVYSEERFSREMRDVVETF